MDIEEIAKIPSAVELLTRRVSELEKFIEDFAQSIDDEVDTAAALRLTGIKSRTTLIEERDKPGSLLKYSKHGRSVSYSRKSCLDYKQRKRLNSQSLPTMRVCA